ncbi:MAG TPA: hypothetical protein VIY48_11715 [Candidatus Paceibacterota bacterium]
MRVIPNLEHEFIEICEEYSKVDQSGKDIITLVKMFAEANEDITPKGLPLDVAWHDFLNEHARQVTAPMVEQILYLLLTYWEVGQTFFAFLPPLEKILLREVIFKMSEEIQRRSDATLAG